MPGPDAPAAPTRQQAGSPTLLDNRSAPCAVGLIRAARVMETLDAGQRLEVWSRDQFAPYEVPIWAENDGHTVEVKERTGKWPRRHWRFVIRRGADKRASD